MSSLAPSTWHLFNRRSLGLRAAFTAVGNEVAKGLIHAWSERLQILIELPLFIVAFLFFALFVGRGDQIAGGRLEWTPDPTRVSWMFVGYAVWIFFYLQTAKLFWRLLGEIQTGTLEQVYLSPLPTWLVATAGRVLATVVETLGVVAALYAVVYVIVPFHLNWRALAVFPLIFTLAGSVGYSLIVGGMTLMWKRVELLNDLVISVMVIFSGALVPLDHMPTWMADLGRVSPLSHGIISLRAVLLDGRATIPLGGDGGLLWLLATSAAYLFAGITVFSVADARARRQGSLGRY